MTCICRAASFRPWTRLSSHSVTEERVNFLFHLLTYLTLWP